MYIVESLECDWDTHTIRQCVFSTLELADKYIHNHFALLEQSDNWGRNVVKSYYGYNVSPEVEVLEDENGNDYYEYYCEYDKVVVKEYLNTPHSITISEVEVISENDW